LGGRREHSGILAGEYPRPQNRDGSPGQLL
jgi:hypothetical protein